VVAPVHAPLIALGNLIPQVGNRVSTIFDVVDHVMWNDPVLAHVHQLCRRFDSTSKNPIVAIDYAYGVDRAQHVGGHIAPARVGGYNHHAFIAVLDEQAGDADPNAGSIQIVGQAGNMGPIAQQRINRDSEILVGNLRAANVVDLPAPNANDMQQTLHDAEQCLIQAGVAVP